MTWAQVEDRYEKGNIPVVNGRVLFQDSVTNMLSGEKAYQRISEWAKESVQIAYSLGIINGMGDGNFAPKENALREQAFVMLSRFVEKIK